MIITQQEHKKKRSWSLHFNFRKSSLCFLLSIIFLCFIPILEAQSPKEENSIQLTPHEKDWLSKHPVIRIAPDPHFPPIEWIDNNGNYRGIAADFMQLIQKKIGINLKVIICKNWDEVLAKAKSREVDSLSAAAQTPERSKYLLYSDPHIVLPGVIITTKKVTGKITLKDLSAMRVSVVKAYVWQEFLETDFPNIKLDLVPDLQTGLKKVALGISDSLVATLPVALYYIEKEGITNLRVAGETGYYTRLSFASRKDWPEFNAIVKKALAKIPQSEKEGILRRWIHLEEKPLFKRKEFWVMLVVVVGAFGLIISGIALWNRSLRRKVGQRTEELKKEFIQRRKADKALLESEERYRTLIQTLTDVVFIIEPNGRFTYINPEFENLTGYHAHDFIGRPFTDILAPEYIESTVERFKRGLSGETIPIYEVEFLHKDGKKIPVELKVTSLLDGDGKTVGRIGLARDIRNRKQAEEMLRESEAEKKAILDGITTNMRLVNENLETIWVNKAAAASVNKSLEEMVGHRCYEFWGDDPEKPCDGCSVMKVFSTKKAAQIIRHTPDGKILDLKAEPVFSEKGNLVGVIEIAYDITDKSRLEDQLQRAQKMEAIGTLAGGVAHDLNNVLSGIVSYPDLLLIDLPEDSPLRKPILTIQSSGQKAAAIVQDLLTLARRGVVATEVTNLNHIVNSYLKSPEHEKLREFHPGLKIKSDLEIHLLNIMGSSVHLSKTVMNLITNAAEAMPEGGTIFISTHSRYIDKPIRGYDDVKEGDYVILTVSDTGIGISSLDLERIFEPFYTKKVMGRSGTGLGMAVVWGTVKDHKGYIDVQSTPGKGTTFTLYLPVTRKEIMGKEEALPMEEYMGKGESILIVDDVEEQREIASRILIKLGYSVTSVSSGEEAIEYMKDNSADLLVLDMIMDPGIDGLDTYKNMLELHPNQKAIIASGFSETERVKEAQRLGAGEYIKKPYTLEKIGIAVKEELGE